MTAGRDLYEGFELALFMISACVFTVILFHSGYPGLLAIPSAVVRRILMGTGVGVTAILIIHSPTTFLPARSTCG